MINLTQYLEEKEHRDLALKQVQEKMQAKMDRRDFRPVVYFGSVEQRIAGRPGQRNGFSVEIKQLHIGGLHKKPASIVNYLRRGCKVLDYYIPSEEQIRAQMNSVKQNQNITISGAIAEYAVDGDSPYAVIRDFLKQEKDKTVTHWKNLDRIIELEQRNAELEKAAANAQAAGTPGVAAEKQAKADRAKAKAEALKAQLEDDEEEASDGETEEDLKALLG